MRLENIAKLKTTSEVRARVVEELKKTLGLSRQALQRRNIALLNEALMYAWSHSPFYVQRFKDGKLPQRIGQNTEWHQSPWTSIPFTTKEDLRDAYPFGFLAVDKSRLFRYGESTGSTGLPPLPS